MARKAKEIALAEPPAVEDAVVRADLQTADALVVAQQQQDSRVRAVALQLGYQLPADATDPDLIQRDIAANMRRSVEACLEVGRGLRVLKEACQHGQFMARLDVLGIEQRVANQFMQAALKFSKWTSTSTLNSIGNQTKLFEMLVLDDEQIEELELTGQTGELTLDDVATMSVKELRAALREAREQAKAKDRLMADKNAKIDELSASLETKPAGPVTQPWDEKVAPFKAEVSAHFDLMEESIGRLTLCHDAILQGDFGESTDPEGSRLALRTCAVLYGDRLNRMAQQLAELCDHYEATLAGWAGELDGRELNPTATGIEA
jgi:hypothetical protein